MSPFTRSSQRSRSSRAAATSFGSFFTFGFGLRLALLIFRCTGGANDNRPKSEAATGDLSADGKIVQKDLFSRVNQLFQRLNHLRQDLKQLSQDLKHFELPRDSIESGRDGVNPVPVPKD